MTLKSLGSKSLFLAACAALCGCQNSQPRTQSPAFTRSPQTTQQFAGQPTMQQGVGTPTSNTMMQSSFPQSSMQQSGIPQSSGVTPSGMTQPGLGSSGINTAPTQSPAFSGNQSRSTQPYAPPTNTNSFGGQPSSVPPLGTTSNAPTFDSMPAPLPPPPLR